MGRMILPTLAGSVAGWMGEHVAAGRILPPRAQTLALFCDKTEKVGRPVIKASETPGQSELQSAAVVSRGREGRVEGVRS